MADWNDQGTMWEDKGPPLNTWFGVDTTTGAWQRPGQPTLGAVSGADLGLGLDLTAPFPGAGQGYGVQAPGTPSLGQVSGLGAPTRATPSALPRPPGLPWSPIQGREPLSAFLPQPPSVWESIARGVGMATPQGRAILQGYDQQAQQGIQNRLALRRQQMLEEQETRQATRDEFETFVKITQQPSKALRNMMFDRLVAEKAQRGETVAADWVDAYKKSSLAEGQQMARLMAPLFTAAGMDPVEGARLLEEGTPIKDVVSILETGQKGQTLQQERDRLAALDKVSAGETLGDVSGVQTPAAPGAAPTPAPVPGERPTARTGTMAPAPAAIEADIAEAHRLYPQVPVDLIRATMLHESSYSVDAKGTAGEIGLMQLKLGTAKDMGVDPHDRRQNVIGGTRYLAQQLRRYGGNQAKALAAYNQGPGNVPVEGPLPPKGQAYAQQVLGHMTARTAPDTRMQVAGPGAPAPTTPAPSAEDQAALMRLKQAIALKDRQIEAYARVGGDEGNRRADNAAKQRDVLQRQRDRLEDRLTETPRAVQKATALHPLELAKQRAGAEVTLEAKMNEPIGTENAIKMNLPAETRWKDVPTGTRVLDRPGEGVTTKLGDFKASYEGITRVIGMLDNPKAVSIVGTLLSSEDNAAFRRLAGEWISSVTPAERKFAAALVAEIAGIRNTISGQAVSAQEAEFLKPMLPSVADPDVATIRAKLEVLQEWIARKHEGARTQMDELGFRTPKALPQPTATTTTTTNQPGTLPAAKEDLLKKYTR